MWPPDYKIRKSKRAKNISLKISPSKGLEIVIPNNRKRAVNIDRLINEHKEWIFKNISIIQKASEPVILPKELNLLSINENWRVKYFLTKSKQYVASVDSLNTIIVNYKNNELFHLVYQNNIYPKAQGILGNLDNNANKSISHIYFNNQKKDDLFEKVNKTENTNNNINLSNDIDSYAKTLYKDEDFTINSTSLLAKMNSLKNKIFGRKNLKKENTNSFSNIDNHIDKDIFNQNSYEMSNEKNIKKMLKKWLVKKAYKNFLPKLIFLSIKFNLPFKELKIRGQKTIWGSCDNKQTIKLNYKLLFLPEILVEHIMLHELSHTKYMNHGKKFWDLLKKLDSNCNINNKRLKSADNFIPSLFLSSLT